MCLRTSINNGVDVRTHDETSEHQRSHLLFTFVSMELSGPLIICITLSS